MTVTNETTEITKGIQKTKVGARVRAREAIVVAIGCARQPTAVRAQPQLSAGNRR